MKPTFLKQDNWENIKSCLPFSYDKQGYGKNRWKKIKAVGFKKFLIISTLGWLVLYFCMAGIALLIKCYLPTLEESIVSIIVYTCLGALFSLIKWKNFEYKYEFKKSKKLSKN